MTPVILAGDGGHSFSMSSDIERKGGHGELSTNSGALLEANPGQSKKANGKGHGQGKSRGKALGLKDIDDADPVFLIQQISAYLCPSDSDAGITFTLREDTTNFLSQSTTAGPVATARTWA